MSNKRHSFDVFDTALTRTVARPADLFAQQSPIASVTPARWQTLRIEAEQQVRRQSQREDITLEAIYEHLAPSIGWNGEETRQALATELELEAKNLRPVPEIRERVAQLHCDGHSVAFISDVYLPASFLQDQLIQQGFWKEGDRLYVSSEEGVTKHSGGLYRVMLDRETLQPGNLCHTGDHAIADDRSARRMGLRTTPFTAARLNLHERAVTEQSEIPLEFRSAVAAASRLARLSRPGIENPTEQTLWDVGASMIGPMLTGYVAWCLREAEQRGIRRLYFVSRDGQILHRIAKALCRSENLDIECRYLFGSRQAWHLPALTKMDASTLDWILDSTLHLSVHSVLTRVGLDPASFAAELKENGFDDSTGSRHLDVSERNRLKILLSEDPLRSAVLAKAKQHRESAAEYLRQEGLLDSTPWAMVDMGWSGRMQGSLRSLLGILGSDRPVTGFYFALKGSCTATDGDTLLSFLDPAEFAARGLCYIPVLETLTAADHGSVMGYRQKTDGGFSPVFHHRALEARNFPWVRTQQDAAVAFAEEFGQLISAGTACKVDSQRIAALLMKRFFGWPTREEARAYRLFRVGEDQAGGRLYRLATPITPQRYWAALLRGGSFLYRLRWPEACIASSLNHPRLRIALLHGRQALAGWKNSIRKSSIKP